jgi:hypothetical protein
LALAILGAQLDFGSIRAPYIEKIVLAIIGQPCSSPGIEDMALLGALVERLPVERLGTWSDFGSGDPHRQTEERKQQDHLFHWVKSAQPPGILKIKKGTAKQPPWKQQLFQLNKPAY